MSDQPMKPAGAAGPPPSLPVNGGGSFAVRQIFAVGQNYPAHAHEMGIDPRRTPPVFFMKPPFALRPGDGPVAYPPLCDDLHHEIELVLALGRGGHDLSLEAAEAAVFGYAAGIDLTRRDLQRAAREKGMPWDLAKGFAAAAPCSAIAPAADTGRPAGGAIWLDVNGKRRQDADIADMTWQPVEVIAALSRYLPLAAGDLIFTGTPAGVAALERGDKASGGVEGVGAISIEII